MKRFGRFVDAARHSDLFDPFYLQFGIRLYAVDTLRAIRELWRISGGPR